MGGFAGAWIKEKLPRAALLGTISGIGFIWMATQGVFDVYSDPVVGLPVLIVALFGVFGGYLFPKKIPPMAVAIVGGIIYALALGRTKIDFTGIGFYFPNPATTVQGLINGFAVVIPYLTIIIPVEIYNFIETMDNVESAQVAGDNYSVKEAQFTDGICTMISAIFGGVVPNTVWLGHAGLKKTGAGIGYSVITGIVLGLSGIFGLFTLLSSAVPPAVCAVTFLWCAIVMVAQAFKECEVKHYAAIGVAMVPPVADYMFTQITGTLGAVNIWTEIQASGLDGYGAEITEALIANGVMWSGVSGVKSGAILIGILLSTITVFIIDRKLDKVALITLVAAVLSSTGFIHSAKLGFNFKSPFTIGYITVTIISYYLHLKRDTWFKADEDFEYV